MTNFNDFADFAATVAEEAELQGYFDNDLDAEEELDFNQG